MRSIIHRLRTRLPSPDGEPPDEQLLDEFLAHRAEEAFAAIFRRHGPMVRGVCRRVLRDEHDTDDAVQAVFIVLFRKADSVRPRSRLGNWLYGVAVNVARRGRESLTRRRTLELTQEPVSFSADRAEQNDLRGLIDQELNELPDAYRAAVVACDLEGWTRSEAAGRLGWSEGTVASRLARGRALLADRLRRRGGVVPAAGLLVALGAGTADAAPSLNLAELAAPSPVVETLANETIRAMAAGKLKDALLALAAVVGLAGTGVAAVWAAGGFDPRPAPGADVRPTENRPNVPVMAWMKPAAGINPGADKPPGGDAGAAKAPAFVLTNPAGDITVVSDRDETLVAFFRRQPVLIATLPAAVRTKSLAGEAPTGHLFLDSASFNERDGRATVYGTSVKVAALPTGTPGRGLVEAARPGDAVVLVRPTADPDLWVPVGVTRRASHGFFAGKERVGPDDFAPVDLIHEKPKP